MSVATFVIPAGPKPPEELIVFECMECHKEVLATETDTHAAKKHKASIIRVFMTPGAYQDFIHEQKIRAAMKENS